MPNKKINKKSFTKSIINIFIIILLITSISKYTFIRGLFNDVNFIISGNEFVNKDDINNIIQPELANSIMSINIESIKNDLISHEYIETAQLSLIFPNKININIFEVKPILFINLNNKKFFIDSNGKLISANKNSIKHFHVPIVKIENNLSENNNNITNNLTNIFKFLITKYPTFYSDLHQINIEKNQWIFLCDYNTKIYTLSNDIISQLNTLKYFEKTVYPAKIIADYAYVDLRILDKVIVKEKSRKG